MTERDEHHDPELAALYRAASTEEPPAGLDARIFAAARGAAPRARPTARSFAERWKVPFALAASVLLATTLTLIVREQPDEPSLAAPNTEPVQTPPAAASSAAKQTVQPASRAAAPESVHTEQRDAPAAAPRAAAPDAGPPTRAIQKNQGALRDTLRAPELSRSGGAPTPERKAMSAARSASAEIAERSPDQWIESIRQLRKDGRAEEAAKVLADFKKRYPDYVLPEDLKQP